MLFRRICALLTFVSPLYVSAQSTPRWVVGGEDDAETQLGRIRGVVALPRGFVVLEADAPFLKVFDYSGRLLQTLGRNGRGPGEFRGPSSISFDARQQRLLVVDASNARVTSYQVRDSLTSPRFLTLEDIGVRSVCTIGPRMFGLARNAPTILRELREEDGRLRVLASFGEPRTNHQLGTHPLVRTRASDGPLLCDEAGNRVIAASTMLGEVHVFDVATRTQTSTLPDGFQRMTLTVDNNSMTMAPPANGYDGIVGLAVWEGAVQVVTERSRALPGDGPVSLGFAVAPMSPRAPGAMGARTQWRPLAKTAAGALCSQNEPAPAIALFSAGRCP
jgi:hypothetical protein